MQYVVDQREKKNIVFTAFVGDIVEHGDGVFYAKDGARTVGSILVNPSQTSGDYRLLDTRAEWDSANRAISILSRSSIPFGMSPGNHDYDDGYWTYTDAGWTQQGTTIPSATPRDHVSGRVWDLYFGPQSRHFVHKPWYGGSFNQGLNSYQFFTGGGKRFLHFAFEMQPSQAVLNWAQGVIDANPGLPVILSTHDWLNPRYKDKKRSDDYDVYFHDSAHLTPDQIWDRFVRKNPAIFLVLCGHLWTEPRNGVSQGEDIRIDKNDAGYPVYQVLQDYQANSVGPDGKAGSVPGGAGWLRFIAFDTEKRKMHFYTYSTLIGRYAGRDGYLPFGIPAEYSDFELDFPPQLLK
ncbi:phosphoesterase [Novosphingobium album (ex Liu et al. 2023)]|nr:phosphoesterase [Novosphingobium album (ex Liu et al. 2023)]